MMVLVNCDSIRGWSCCSLYQLVASMFFTVFVVIAALYHDLTYESIMYLSMFISVLKEIHVGTRSSSSKYGDFLVAITYEVVGGQ